MTLVFRGYIVGETLRHSQLNTGLTCSAGKMHDVIMLMFRISHQKADFKPARQASNKRIESNQSVLYFSKVSSNILKDK